MIGKKVGLNFDVITKKNSDCWSRRDVRRQTVPEAFFNIFFIIII